MIKRVDYYSFEALEEDDEALNKHDVVTVVHDRGWSRADIVCDCKSWKTALRRFFRGLGYDRTFAGWEEGLIESCENGYFTMNDFRMADGKANPYPSWAYGVEQLDSGYWYVFLNVKTA